MLILCRDCRHLETPIREESQCQHQDAQFYTSPVTGESSFLTAKKMRSVVCGIEATLFEPIDRKVGR